VTVKSPPVAEVHANTDVCVEGGAETSPGVRLQLNPVLGVIADVRTISLSKPPVRVTVIAERAGAFVVPLTLVGFALREKSPA